VEDKEDSTSFMSIMANVFSNNSSESDSPVGTSISAEDSEYPTADPNLLPSNQIPQRSNSSGGGTENPSLEDNEDKEDNTSFMSTMANFLSNNTSESDSPAGTSIPEEHAEYPTVDPNPLSSNQIPARSSSSGGGTSFMSIMANVFSNNSSESDSPVGTSIPEGAVITNLLSLNQVPESRSRLRGGGRKAPSEDDNKSFFHYFE